MKKGRIIETEATESEQIEAGKRLANLIGELEMAKTEYADDKKSLKDDFDEKCENLNEAIKETVWIVATGKRRELSQTDLAL